MRREDLSYPEGPTDRWATRDVSVHRTALVETDEIGRGTRIWAFTHILSGASIGADCNVGDHCFIEGGAHVGDGVTIKNGNALWEGVTLQDGVFVGPSVVFTNDLYPRSPRLEQARERYTTKDWLVPTLVEHGATIGAGAVVLAGTTIGAFALVAAQALVTRDVPAHALVRGSPAELAGWVCRCGTILGDGARILRCPACGSSFVRQDGAIALQPLPGEPT
jgi:UDP-2-acetamido-3-amino-2,3-dideoxy-glucuronate N-acetyltransferase